MIDVIHRKCSFSGCLTHATYGLIGNVPAHCAVHADKRMEIFRPNRHCMGCNEYPIHCEAHSHQEEKTFIVLTCSSCDLPAVIDSRGH